VVALTAAAVIYVVLERPITKFLTVRVAGRQMSPA
jgi:hypothetical protein